MALIGVLAIISISLVPIFYNVFKYPYPIGYAGMYAQMAEQIARDNFKLPMEIEFYGSGGVPAAFPPLGMYLLALNLKMGGPFWLYVRFLPAILSSLALLGLFLITRQMTTSRITGLIAILLASSSPYLYASHTWAAGIVRGLAYMLGLFFFYYFIRITHHFSKKEIFMAGILLSLTVMTHLSYAFFFILWSVIWVLVNPHKETWLRAIWIGFTGALLSLPWALTIVNRYGWQVFSNALGSHGTLSISQLSGSFSALIDLTAISLSEIIKQPVLAIAGLIGVVYCIGQKRWFLLLAFIFTSLFTFESRRFIIVLGCIFSGIALESTAKWLIKSVPHNQRLFSSVAACVAGVVIIGVIYINEFQTILEQMPSLSPALIETSEYIKTNTLQGSFYLVLADHNEAEWFPFLTKRNQLFAFWGSEWSGNRNMLSTGFYNSMICGQNADFACLEETIQTAKNPPQYLVVMKRKYRGFIDILKDRGNWVLSFNNSEYQVWKKTTP